MKFRRQLRFQDRILLLALLAAVPALIAAALLWTWETSSAVRWTTFAIMTALAIGSALAVRAQVVRPLRTLANVFEALREGDYAIRGQAADAGDALGDVINEVNALSQLLHEQRLSTIEAGALFEKFVSEADIALLAFDPALHLCRINAAGESLLGRPSKDLIGRSAQELGVSALLEVASGSVVSTELAGGKGRLELRRRTFRHDGRPHELLMISDVSRALREEERRAWRRLVRVIGHELNNSLAPIKSTAGTLTRIIDQEPLASDWREDTRTGLAIIHDRAESLERFMSAYARFARLPAPNRREVDFSALARRAAALFERVHTHGEAGVTVSIDGDQIEQVLINLIKNAVEAGDGAGDTDVSWRTAGSDLFVEIKDEGPGIASTESLWVPFFTTKQSGSGIGLVLSREIVENHGGQIALANRPDRTGCVATIVLPR